MRGQASIETLLILAAVLSTVAALVIMGQQSSEITNAEAAARLGAENAIAALNMENGCMIDITWLGLRDDAITIQLAVRGPGDLTAIEGEIGNSAEKYLLQAGHTYGVEVTAERVTK